MIIGIDFDNTIAIYDELIHRIALQKEWITPTFPKSKLLIRNHLRDTLGDEAWQEIQYLIYGPQMSEAKLSQGFLEWLGSTISGGHSVCIVSHKTRFSHHSSLQRVDMRESALYWMEVHGILKIVSKDRVYFANDRDEKAKIIDHLKCDIFVDDLIEVFENPFFPKETKRILFSGEADMFHKGELKIPRLSNWSAMHEHI